MCVYFKSDMNFATFGIACLTILFFFNANQLWFVFLGHMVYFFSSLHCSGTTCSVCRVESSLFIPDVQKKTQTSNAFTHKGSLGNLLVHEPHLCCFKASVIPYSYTYSQELCGNHEFSHKGNLLSMPISSDLFLNINYEVFGHSVMTLKLLSFCSIHDSGIQTASLTISIVKSIGTAMTQKLEK